MKPLSTMHICQAKHIILKFDDSDYKNTFLYDDQVQWHIYT